MALKWHGNADATPNRARDCRAWLTGQGWPLPILADSGNGVHLLYRIDLPNDQAATARVKGVLESLAARFTDSAVEVDRPVFNAARICKRYGTLSAKGDSTPQRPHRISRMLDVPDSVNVVPRELLEKLAAIADPQPERASHAAVPVFGLNIQNWLLEHGFNVTKTKDYNLGDRHGTLYEIAPCPWRPEEKGGGAWIIQWDDGTVTAGCHNAKCIGRGWPDLLAVAEGRDNAGKTADDLVVLEAPDDPHRLARNVRDESFRVADVRCHSDRFLAN
jgi:hypothetical protein